LARLLQALAQDESPWVRAAAALAAEQAAPARPEVVEALVRALTEEHPWVEQAVRQALEEVPPRVVAPVALAAFEREVARREPRGSALKSLVGLLEAGYGAPLGYYPGMPPRELRALAQRVRERLGSAPAERR
jgi:HEAT repeat protein